MASKKFAGLTFAITGKLSRKRDEIVGLISDAGGFVADSVTGAVNYLVVGDTGRNGVTTKMQAARKRGTRLIDEKRLWGIVAGPVLIVDGGPAGWNRRMEAAIARRELDEEASASERLLGVGDGS